MKPKWFIIIVGCLLAFALMAATPTFIARLILQGDADGGTHSITNAVFYGNGIGLTNIQGTNVVGFVPGGGGGGTNVTSLNTLTGAVTIVLATVHSNNTALAGPFISGQNVKIDLVIDDNLSNNVQALLAANYASPGVSIILSPSPGLREKGVTVSLTDFRATTTKRANNIASLLFKQGATTIRTLNSGSTPAIQSGGGTEPASGANPATLTSSFTANTTFTVTVTDVAANGNGPTSTSDTGTYSFVYPVFYGVGSSGLTGAQLYALPSGITKSVQNLVNTTFSSSPSSQRFYFAYPDASNNINLVSILDANGFETISGYTRRTSTITGLDGTTQNYTIYESNVNTTQSGFANTFKFN